MLDHTIWYLCSIHNSTQNSRPTPPGERLTREEEHDTKQPDMGERECPPNLHPAKPIYFVILPGSSVLSQSSYDIILLASIEEASMGGRTGKKEESEKAPDNGEQTFEDENPRPAWPPADPVHADNTVREDARKCTGQRGG
jgi:hypothetical protein